MSHDRNTNEPHAHHPNPHDHGVAPLKPKRKSARQLLFILIPLGFFLLIGAMLLTARVTDSTPHSGAQAPPALQDQAPADAAPPAGTERAGTAPAN